MTGAFLNSIGILLGALFGLAWRTPLSEPTQNFFRQALGAGTVFAGLRLVWLHLHGTFLACAGQLLLALVAVTLGCWVGKLLRLQRISNRLGRYAGKLITATQSKTPPSAGEGFIACTILFCAAPLGWLGAVTDGLTGDYYLLAVKAVMDGLAMSSFVKMFHWPAALSAFPVYILLGAVTLACQDYAKPWLESHALVDSIGVAGGLLACIVALVILEARKVELASYLPGLVVAPVLAWFFH